MNISSSVPKNIIKVIVYLGQKHSLICGIGSSGIGSSGMASLLFLR